MNMQNAFSEPVEILAQYEALADRLARGVTVETGEALACASALASALRAALMTSTAAPKRAAKPKAGTPLTFEMTAESLARALRVAMRAAVTSGRSAGMIMSYVRLDAAGDALLLTCNDCDREISVEIAAPGIGAWSAIVEAKALAASLSKAKGAVTMRGEETELRSVPATAHAPAHEWRDTVLHVAGAVTATIQGRCVNDWPKAPPQRAPYQLLIQPGELRDLLAFVAPGMSEEATRYYLNGAFIHVADGHLAAVATDGHRMHVAKLAAWHGLDFKGQIIPRDTVGDILAMLAAPVEGFAFAVSETGVTLKAGPFSLSSKIVDASFPDYTRVVPSRPKHTVEMVSADLDGALAKAVAIKGRNGMARLTFGADVVEVSAKTLGGASMSAEIAAPGCGHGFEVGFNVSYLRDALKVTEGERVAFRFDGPADPFTITAANSDGSRLVVIVPLRA